MLQQSFVEAKEFYVATEIFYVATGFQSGVET